MSQTMRRAGRDDLEEIIRIHIDAYETALGNVLDRSVLDASHAQRLPMWTALLTTPPANQAVFVRQINGKVSGFVSAGPTRSPDPDGDSGEIYALFVDPAYWRSGVGGSLLAEGVEYLRSLGLHQAKLWVLDLNELARRFYEGHSWEASGEVRQDRRGRFLRYQREL